MYEKSNILTYIAICNIDSQKKFAVWLINSTGALYQPGGVRWGRRLNEEGIYVYLWLFHVEV